MIQNEQKVSEQQFVYILLGFALLDVLLIIFGVTSIYFSLIPVEVVAGVFVLAAFLASVVVVLYVSHLSKLAERFWKELAAEYGYTYVWKPYFQNDALMFREGHNKSTTHGLMGTIEDRAFRFFQYSYQNGFGKSAEYRFYSVFEVVFSGTFPHFYLNNTHNKSLSGIKEFFLPRVSPPPGFNQKFRLYAPKGYEREAFEILTPDVLAVLDVDEWRHDIELVESKLFVFSEQRIRSKEELDVEMARLHRLVKVLSPNLNRITLVPVGDLTHKL
ncbi:SPP1 phage holin family protein [Patescibacteria group bacterium]|nr:SPP1 phage holin family protein [Patescibacteria group bacterium]